MDFRSYLFAALGMTCLLVNPIRAQTAAATTNAASAVSTNLVVTPAPLAPAQVVSEAEAALAKLRDITAGPATDADETAINDRLPAFALETKFHVDETQRMLEAHPSLDQIRSAQNTWKYIAATPAGWKETLTRRATALSATLADLDQQKTQWTGTQKAVSGPGIPAEVTQRIQDVLAQLAKTSQLVASRQTQVLALQDQVIKQESQVATVLTALSQARDEAVTQLFVQNGPPIWKNGVGETTSPALPTESWAAQIDAVQKYFAWQSGRFFAHGVLLVCLFALFYWLRGQARKWAEAEPAATGRQAVQIFETPACAALLLALVIGVYFYPLAPRLLLALMSAVALLPAVVLLRRLLEPRLFPILNALVVFFFAQEFRSVVSLSPIAARLFFLSEMLAAMLFLIWLLYSRRLRNSENDPRHFGKALRFAAKCALALITAAWLANVLGFDRLGNLLSEAVQRSANLALILYAGLQVLNAFLLIALRLRPLSTLGIVRLHSGMLARRIYRVLAVGAGIVWVLFTLEMFSLRASVLGAIERFLSTRVNDHLVLTVPGKLVVAGLVVWGAFLLSRLVRLVMESDVYPRLRLAHGIPYAVSTMLHYAVLVVGFMGVTAALGVDMTKFTILVSALGVGVGFGLQNIINNFVSGLILLFERPVKIGDSVQVDSTIGVVERIGIRASVLRAATGAELIVPNGNLISNSVTNWTLSSQERIISIPLSVTRGPDIAHVIDLLIATAKTNPKVLSSPSPQVLVLTLGATLSFEVRVWTNASEDWNQVRSEVILALNAALVRENIAIA